MHQDSGTTGTTIQRPKQKFILLNILALTLCTATSNGLYRETDYRYFINPLSVPGVLLMLILTEWAGRRVLFKTLYILSLLSSVLYLSEFHDFCGIVHAPVQGAAVALLSVVICEYCDPKHRLLYLIANSAVQMFFYWVAYLTSSESEYSLLLVFGIYLQYLNIFLEVLGLWSVFEWPESPYWLASKRRFDESARAFVAVRGGDSKSSEELRALTDAQPRPASIKMFYAPLLLALPVLCMSVPTFDTVYLFKTITYSLISKDIQKTFGTDWLFVTLKCIAAIACVGSVLIPIKVSRKVLFLTCALIFSAKFYIFEVFFDTRSTVFKVTILVLETLVDYGPRTVTLPLLVELVPQQFVTIITAIFSVMYIILEGFCRGTFVLPYTGSFIVFLSLILCYFVMPEAKEKTLLQIEQMYIPEKKESLQPNQTDV